MLRRVVAAVVQKLGGVGGERLALGAAAVLPALGLVVCFCRTDLTSWDMAGHVQAAAYYRDQLWPSFSGWNATQGFGGYPQGTLYPPLFAWLAGGLAKLVPLAWAVRLLLGASIVALPFSALALMRTLGASRRPAFGAVFFMMTALLLGSNRALGGVFSGTFAGGMLTAQFALPLVFLYLVALEALVARWRGAIAAAAVLALVILSHEVATLGALALSLIFVPVFAGSWRRVRDVAPRFAAHLIAALALAAVFVGPRLAYQGWTSGHPIMSFGLWSAFGTGAWFYVPATALCLVAVVRALRREGRVERALILPLLLMLVLYALLSVLGRTALSSGVALHSYRLLLFVIVFGGLAAGYAWSSGRSSRAPVVAAAAVFCCATVLCAMRDLPFAPRRIGEASAPLPTTRGLVDVSTQSEAARAGSPYLLPATLEARGAQLLNGVFVESSAVSPYVYGLLREIDPHAHVGGAERLTPNPALARWHGSLLGVQWMLSERRMGSDPLGGDTAPVAMDFGLSAGGEERTLSEYLYRPENRLAEFLPAAPLAVSGGSWRDTVRAWWETGATRARVPVRASGSVASYDAPSSGDRVALRQVARDGYELDIVSDAPRWVYVKLPYFPTWHAWQDGSEIPLYEASVHMMAVRGRGRIALASRPGLFERACTTTSLTTWVALGLLALVRLLRRRRRGASGSDAILISSGTDPEVWTRVGATRAAAPPNTGSSWSSGAVGWGRSISPSRKAPQASTS